MHRHNRQQQKDVRSFFSSSSAKSNPRKRPRPSCSTNGSSFQSCPLCGVSFPLHSLEVHASSCEGIPEEQPPPEQLEKISRKLREVKSDGGNAANTTTASSSPSGSHVTQLKEHANGDLNIMKQQQKEYPTTVSPDNASSKTNPNETTNHNAPPPSLPPTAMPIPGLFLFEDFLTEEEERQILESLDDSTRSDFLQWKPSNFNGVHFGKRWGVHCNLRTRTVTQAERPMPWFFHKILIPKFRSLKIPAIQNAKSKWIPNEANAIEYRRKQGHVLKSHVDNRQLSKEPIANLSLAGHCYMTFQNQKTTTVPPKKVLLKRRCLQILTGEARYEYSHGIQNQDLLSARRVSLTLRESPLTQPGKSSNNGSNSTQCKSIQPTLKGLFRKRKSP